MKTKKVTFRDPIIEKVCDQLVSRSDVGYKKYGVTLAEDAPDLQKWLQHLQEELLDAANYVEKLKSVLSYVVSYDNLKLLDDQKND
tara:strand:+ start:224 stop:481 length:258 start_codon:yes stop_codon:yes gene_type:complete